MEGEPLDGGSRRRTELLVTLRAVDRLCAQGVPPTFAEVARELGWSKSKTHRAVMRLVECGTLTCNVSRRSLRRKSPTALQAELRRNP